MIQILYLEIFRIFYPDDICSEQYSWRETTFSTTDVIADRVKIPRSSS